MNRPVHFEIHASNMDSMQKFYEQVFGWKFQPMGDAYGGYRVIVTGENTLGAPMTADMMGINGGMTARRGPLPQNGAAVNAFVNVIGVENVDATVEKVKAAGGSVALEAADMPGVGRLAYCKDLDGAIFGIITPTMPPGPPVA